MGQNSESQISTTIVLPDLPLEIQFDIFSRLPTKWAGKCKCLSKYWRNRVSTPQFINLHLKNRKIHNQENKSIILIAPNTRCLIASPLEYTASLVSTQIPCPPDTLFLAVLASCNGLVLLENDQNLIFLVNPITLQQLIIPSKRIFDTVYVFGFGYDPSCDDYKVVELSWPGGPKIGAFRVYSVRQRAWKKVDNVPCHLIPTHPYYPMAFVNGAVHWLTGIEGRCVVARFDLEYGVFREIPISIDFDILCRSGIFILGGCLCIISHNSVKYTIDMWMMKEYGVVGSWVKYRIQTNDRRVMIEPLCFVNDDEFLYMNNEGRWSLHNVKAQTAKDVYVGGVSGYLTGVSPFVDSLVSLDQYA